MRGIYGITAVFLWGLFVFAGCLYAKAALTDEFSALMVAALVTCLGGAIYHTLRALTYTDEE